MAEPHREDSILPAKKSAAWTKEPHRLPDLIGSYTNEYITDLADAFAEDDVVADEL